MNELQSPWLPREERQQNQDLKREAVLLAAARTFGRRGYKATRVDDIAEELHVTKPTIYYYFANKEGLLLACIERTVQIMADKMSDLPSNTSPKLRVLTFLREYVELITSDLGKCMVVISEYDLKPKARERLRDAKRRTHAVLHGMVEQGMEQGVFAKRDSTVVTSTLFGAINSVARWHRPGSMDAEQLGSTISDLLITGLVAR